MASTFPECKLHTSVFETLIINPNIVIAIVFTTSQTQEKPLASPLPPYVFGIKKDHLVINRMYIGLLIECICLEHTYIPAFDHTHQIYSVPEAYYTHTRSQHCTSVMFYIIISIIDRYSI